MDRNENQGEEEMSLDKTFVEALVVALVACVLEFVFVDEFHPVVFFTAYAFYCLLDIKNSLGGSKE